MILSVLVKAFLRSLFHNFTINGISSHCFIFSAFSLSFLVCFSFRGEISICKHNFSLIDTLEYADKILSIGSTSKVSYVLIG